MRWISACVCTMHMTCFLHTLYQYTTTSSYSACRHAVETESKTCAVVTLLFANPNLRRLSTSSFSAPYSQYITDTNNRWLAQTHFLTFSQQRTSVRSNTNRVSPKLCQIVFILIDFISKVRPSTRGADTAVAETVAIRHDISS